MLWCKEKTEQTALGFRFSSEHDIRVTTGRNTLYVTARYLVSSMPETSGIHVQPFLQAPDAMPLDSMIGLRKYISHPMRLPMLLWLSSKFYNSRILFKALQQKPGTLASVQIRWLARCWIVSRHKSSGCDVEMGLIQSCCSLTLPTSTRYVADIEFAYIRVWENNVRATIDVTFTGGTTIFSDLNPVWRKHQEDPVHGTVAGLAGSLTRSGDSRPLFMTGRIRFVCVSLEPCEIHRQILWNSIWENTEKPSSLAMLNKMYLNKIYKMTCM